MKVTARTGASADAINRYRYEVRGEVEDAYRDSSRDTWYHYGNAVVYAIQLSKGQRVTMLGTLWPYTMMENVSIISVKNPRKWTNE